jgi:hypothetical protein
MATYLIDGYLFDYYTASQPLIIDGNLLTSIFRSTKAPPKHWQGASKGWQGYLQ